MRTRNMVQERRMFCCRSVLNGKVVVFVLIELYLCRDVDACHGRTVYGNRDNI